MDPDGDKSIKSQLNNKNIEILQKNTNYMFNDSNVFQSVWIRCIIQTNNEFDKKLLDYGFNFLPYFGSIFWIIYLFT